MSSITWGSGRGSTLRSSEESLTGALVVDKPLGWTSHDVVNKVRRVSGIRKVGHLGTLDPNATGVLPLLLGRATRLAQFFGGADKGYEAVVRFGFSTDTYDAMGKPSGDIVEMSPSRAAVEEALTEFRGPLKQIPPPVSAKKIAGVPAYKLARQNKPVELAPVDVTVFNIELTSFEGREAGIRIRCSSGTYVRSIAHDMGRMLGCGAHLATLRRTSSGEFDLSAAKTIEQLQELAARESLSEVIIRPNALLKELPAEYVDQPNAGFIRQGRAFRSSPFGQTRGSKYVRAIGPDGELIAIGEAKSLNLYQPILVL